MRPLKNLCEVAVIGGGLAGLSAARHAARLGRLVTLFEGSGLYGGQVATVGEVEGLPFPGTHSGQDLSIHLLEDARKVGVQSFDTGIARICADQKLVMVDEAGNTHHPHVIIIASGARLRRLNVSGEERLLGRGVSRCATCDSSFFRNQDVVVAGGGDAAFHEALVLAKTSRTVTMICRSPARAKRAYIDKLAAQVNVNFLWDSLIEEILGADGVDSVRVRNTRTGNENVIACTGVFPFIGVEANIDGVPRVLLSAEGLVATNPDFATADPRIFACGAVRAGYGGNAVQAMAEGVGAAAAASRMLIG